MFRGAFRNVVTRYFVDHDSDHRKTTFVAGMGRSGTTWLVEMLNFRNEYRLVYEPFDHSRVALAVNFSDHQYLRAQDEDERYFSPARAIVTGRVREDFVDQHNRKLICDRRIVKEVRANLFLRWLYERFPGMPIVLIVRNPFAVAASRLATAADIDLQAEFLSQADLVDDYLHPYRDVMLSCRTPLERQLAAWCVEVGVPLAQFRSDEICVVFYEDLVTRPADALTRICAHISRRYDARMLRVLTRPSRTTLSRERLEKSWTQGPRSINEAWRARLSPEQIALGRSVLEKFEMQHLYGDEAEPVVDRSVWPRGLRAPIPRESMTSA